MNKKSLEVKAIEDSLKTLKKIGTPQELMEILEKPIKQPKMSSEEIKKFKKVADAYNIIRKNYLKMIEYGFEIVP
jgi:hypothetical protein